MGDGTGIDEVLSRMRQDRITAGERAMAQSRAEAKKVAMGITKRTRRKTVVTKGKLTGNA